MGTRTEEQADIDAAHELALYAVNDAKMYEHAKLCVGNLAKKLHRGTYDAKLALVLWEHHAAMAAKKYAVEFEEDKSWHALFNKPTRLCAAMQIANHYDEELQHAVRMAR